MGHYPTSETFLTAPTDDLPRPFAVLQDRPCEEREAREGGLWLKARVAPRSDRFPKKAAGALVRPRPNFGNSAAAFLAKVPYADSVAGLYRPKRRDRC